MLMQSFKKIQKKKKKKTTQVRKKWITDGHMDTQMDIIIPHHYCVSGYEMDVFTTRQAHSDIIWEYHCSSK